MFGREVLVNELETNHISHLDIGFDVRCLPVELLPFLDIFGTIITEIGTERLDYRQFRITSYNVCYTKLLRHAMCDSESGESAFFKIISFQGGSLQNIRGVEPPVMSIKKSLESLLMEAASRSDEQEKEGDTDKTTEGGNIPEIDFDFLESEETTIVITSYSIHYTKLYEKRK